MSINWCSDTSIYPAILAVKEETSEMSLKFSKGTSQSISEIVSSHVWKPKKGQGWWKIAFSYQVSKDTLSYILSIKQLSGLSEVGDHEIYKIQVQVTTFYSIYLSKNEIDITEIAVHTYIACKYIHTYDVCYNILNTK